jgi:predicted Zn-dependent protease with MMP-like domain
MSSSRRPDLSQEAFARLVQQAIADLPPPYAKLMNTIAVMVEDEPSCEVLDDLDLEDEEELMGLYQGPSLTDSSFFSAEGGQPAGIFIYRGPILRQCESADEVVQEVYDTLIHELGHHVGLDDEEMPY